MLNNSDRQICVVIPVYNAKKYLYEAVSSVLNQKYKKIEIILIDDGSCDGSSEICDNLAQRSERIFVIHQKNSGVSAARNAGIDYVLNKYDNNLKKTYVAFLDADDAWIDNFFTEDFMLNLPDVHLVCFQTLICNGKLSRCYIANRVEDGIYTGENKTAQTRRCQFIACLYEVHLLKEYTLRFTEGLNYTEDTQFFRKCICSAEKIAVFNRPFYLYRNNSASAVHTRAFGIQYFEPIFETYLKSDSNGAEFVSWYLIDMIQEHFQHFGTIIALKRWLNNHNEYVLFAKQYGGTRANDVLSALDRSPKKYAFKHYIIGAFYGCLKRIICLPGISSVAECVKYPISLSRSKMV